MKRIGVLALALPLALNVVTLSLALTGSATAAWFTYTSANYGPSCGPACAGQQGTGTRFSGGLTFDTSEGQLVPANTSVPPLDLITYGAVAADAISAGAHVLGASLALAQAREGAPLSPCLVASLRTAFALSATLRLASASLLCFVVDAMSQRWRHWAAWSTHEFGWQASVTCVALHLLAAVLLLLASSGWMWQPSSKWMAAHPEEEEEGGRRTSLPHSVASSQTAAGGGEQLFAIGLTMGGHEGSRSHTFQREPLDCGR
jgi:hypothetical protein